MRRPYTRRVAPPPSFAEASNLRQRVRACGMDPNHWYPVALSGALRRGEVRKARFWGRAVAVFRGQDGVARAIDDRCAHRQVSLSKGEVIGERLVCRYHGWAYDGDGCVAHIPHETFGRKDVRFRVDGFPVAEKYGLVWVFFGERARAAEVPLPVVDELEGPDAWTCQPLEYVWGAHHSMVLDNVSDYTHGWLHRKTEPFRDPVLLAVRSEPDRVHVRYRATIGAGKMMRWFLDRGAMASNTIDLVYDYPYHRSNTDDYIRHFIAVLPEDERTTRVFALISLRRISVPLLGVPLPRRLERAMMAIGKRIAMDPVFAEDGEALELEQEGWEAHWQAPLAELNPQVRAFQELTIGRWEAWLRSTGELPPPEAASSAGGEP